MDLIYQLAEETRRTLFIERGEEVTTEQRVICDTERLTREIRAHLVGVTNQPALPQTFALRAWKATDYGTVQGPPLVLAELPGALDGVQLLSDDRARYLAALEVVEVRKARIEAQLAQDLDTTIAAMETYLAHLQETGKDAGGPAMDLHKYQNLPRYGEAQAIRERIVALYQQISDVRRAKETERRERLAEEKAAWIQAHGSAYLRKAYGAKYDCQRLYVTERAALEHPGYLIDFDDCAAWKDRACPSERALDESLSVDGIVVWLTELPTKDESSWEFEPCEAVVIREYLGKYDLIKPIYSIG